MFFLSQLPIRARLSRLTVELELPDPTEDERVELFRAFLGDVPLEKGLTVEELAQNSVFLPVRWSWPAVRRLALPAGQ